MDDNHKKIVDCENQFCAYYNSCYAQRAHARECTIFPTLSQELVPSGTNLSASSVGAEADSEIAVPDATNGNDNSINNGFDKSATNGSEKNSENVSEKVSRPNEVVTRMFPWGKILHPYYVAIYDLFARLTRNSADTGGFNTLTLCSIAVLCLGVGGYLGYTLGGRPVLTDIGVVNPGTPIEVDVQNLSTTPLEECEVNLILGNNEQSPISLVPTTPLSEQYQKAKEESGYSWFMLPPNASVPVTVDERELNRFLNTATATRIKEQLAQKQSVPGRLVIRYTKSITVAGLKLMQRDGAYLFDGKARVADHPSH